jgi:hypothetical protein
MIANSAFGAKHGVPKAKLFGLSNEDALDALGQDAVHHIGLFDFPLGAQCSF